MQRARLSRPSLLRALVLNLGELVPGFGGNARAVLKSFRECQSRERVLAGVVHLKFVDEAAGTSHLDCESAGASLVLLAPLSKPNARIHGV